MTMISDPEVSLLAKASSELARSYQKADDDAWKGSPFEWIKVRPSRQKGAVGEKLFAGYLEANGFDVSRSPDSEADRIINGKRVEVKMSMLWESGKYKFQQIRDQNYDFLACLGISPFDAHCWAIPKSQIMQMWHDGKISSQHGGVKGRDTAWISVNPKSAPEWLQIYGGKLSESINSINRIVNDL